MERLKWNRSDSQIDYDILVSGEKEAGSEYLIVLPILVIVGLCGNVASLVTILNTRLRKVGFPPDRLLDSQIVANQYLIVLTASDSVFLFGMVMIVFKLDYSSYHMCVVIEYILMVSSYVSSWAIVGLTIERYIAIAFPLRHVKLSHISRAKIMRYWVPIPFVLNLIQFVTLSPNVADSQWPESRQCDVSEGPLQMTAEMADVILSYVAPCLTVVLLNTLIASKVRNAGKDLFAVESSPDHGDSRSSARRRAHQSNSGSTRILLVVPVVYTLLNTPFYLMRILDTLAINFFNSKAFSIQKLSEDQLAVFFYNAAHYLYYVNFASDFLVYAFSSANFRKSVCLAWGKILCPKWQLHTRSRHRHTCADMDTGPTSQRTGIIPRPDHNSRPSKTRNSNSAAKSTSSNSNSRSICDL